MSRYLLSLVAIPPAVVLASHIWPSSLSHTSGNFQYSVARKNIFQHLSQEYEDLGEIERGEVSCTVEDGVFAQMGVLTEHGIDDMVQRGIHPPLRAEDVFCDIGSGVGNVCLQILGKTCVKKVIGVEVIPSRHRNAERAFENARLLFPHVFATKQAVFKCCNLIDCAGCLKEEGTTVVFSHSWMFDDVLMEKLASLVDSVPSIRCVITSRELPGIDGKLRRACERKNVLPKKMGFEADWNEKSPFFVYWRDEKR